MPEDTNSKKTCFIAMPISTPDQYVPIYGGDREHFKHVLDCLFIPAIKAAGWRPFSPISEGAEIIHADIVHQLETADLVLCDMSNLNANVFFEFGIRTALNKPICVVRDDLTSSTPFDTVMINYHTYSSNLSSWIVQNQIKLLSTHLRQTARRSEGQNALWKHFGMKRQAQAPDSHLQTGSNLEHLTTRIIALEQALRSRDRASMPQFFPPPSVGLGGIYGGSGGSVGGPAGAGYGIPWNTPPSMGAPTVPTGLADDQIERNLIEFCEQVGLKVISIVRRSDDTVAVRISEAKDQEAATLEIEEWGLQFNVVVVPEFESGAE